MGCTKASLTRGESGSCWGVAPVVCIGISLHPSGCLSQAWHWQRDIVQSSFVAVGLCYASRNAVTGKQSGFLCCKILAIVNKLSLGIFTGKLRSVNSPNFRFTYNLLF